ncbi:MAG TPA: primosomal protein N' [Elusimicrobiota bacterium]|nr:primosomal protein N' [Elusimicrobiota bacterium]
MTESPPPVLIAEVALPLPIDRLFDYRVPEPLAGVVRPGHRVRVPFGFRGGMVGAVIRLKSEVPAVALKAVEGVLDPDPVLEEKDLALARWISEKYFCSLGEAVFCVLPVGKNPAPKRAVAPAVETPPPSTERPEFVLTESQRAACDVILPAVEKGGHDTFLIYGVAAAGKTEVYITAIERALEKGKSSIYLVPEIGLTPQVETWLRERFGSTVELWHSRLAFGEKWRIWEKVRRGDCRVLMGARSALFAPMKDLGLIVVDEEHDPSYKCDSRPRYHARDAAVEKARLHDVPVVMGSATPSLDSFYRAQQGRIRLVEMAQRVDNRPFPTVHVVDVRRGGKGVLSEPLRLALNECLVHQEQAILLMNRRGFATWLICRDCGWEARCPSCGVALVGHQSGAAETEGPSTLVMKCHYCSHKMPMTDRCPKCKSPTLKLLGKGTQRIDAEIRSLLPTARILRWDLDSMSRKGSHERAFSSVKDGAVDVIVGTQMAAQGLDFPNVTVVGVIDADQALRFPDFRSGERAFQSLAQAAGRSGRAENPGSVFIQTRHPDHYAIQAVKNMDYRLFAETEMKYREEMRYPPFVQLVQIVVRGKRADLAEEAATALVEWFEALPLPDDVACLGPAPAYHSRRGGLSQWQVLLKGRPEEMTDVLKKFRERKATKGVTLMIDVDPEEMH